MVFDKNWLSPNDILANKRNNNASMPTPSVELIDLGARDTIAAPTTVTITHAHAKMLTCSSRNKKARNATKIG